MAAATTSVSGPDFQMHHAPASTVECFGQEGNHMHCEVRAPLKKVNGEVGAASMTVSISPATDPRQ